MLKGYYSLNVKEQYFCCDGKVFLTRNHEGTKCFDVLDLAQELVIQALSLDARYEDRLDVLESNGTNAIAITSTPTGLLIRAYDLIKSWRYPSVQLKTRVAKDHGQLLAAASRSVDNIYFTYFRGSNTISAVMLGDDIQAITIPIRLDTPGIFPETIDKKRLGSASSISVTSGGIKSVVCHPTLQFVFIVWFGGLIQIWSYDNLHKFLVKRSGSSDSSASGVNADDAAAEDGENDDDTSSVAGSTISESTKTSKSKKVASAGSSPARALATALLVPKALLRPPSTIESIRASSEAQAGGIGGGHAVKPVGTGTAIGPVLTVDFAGRLVAVNWGEVIGVGVYDARMSSLLGGSSADNSTASLNNINVISHIGAFQTFPDGWIPDKLAFHPTDPVLLHVLQRPSMQGSPVLWCHTLLEPSLRLLGVQNLESLNHHCGVGEIAIDSQRFLFQEVAACHQGGRVVLSWKNKYAGFDAYDASHPEDSNFLIVIANLSDFWRRQHSGHQTLTSAVNFAPDIFLFGDKMLLRTSFDSSLPGAAATNTTNANANKTKYRFEDWPTLLCVNISSKVSESGLRPLVYSYDVFRASFAASSAAKEAMQFMGTIPTLAVKSAPEIFDSMHPVAGVDGSAAMVPWFKLFGGEAFSLQKDGPFLPASIRCQIVNNVDLMLGGPEASLKPSLAPEWLDIIVVGGTLSPRMIEVSAAPSTPLKKLVSTPSLDRLATICLIRVPAAGPNGNQPTPIFLAASDACFWTGPDSFTDQSTKQIGNGILLLSSNGFQVTWVSLDVSDPAKSYRNSKTWSFPVAMSSLHAPQPNCLNCIVYVTAPMADDFTVPTNSSKLKSKIILSEIGSAALPTSSVRREFTLDEGESVLELAWQPKPIAEKPVKLALNPSFENIDADLWRSLQNKMWTFKTSTNHTTDLPPSMFVPLLAVLTTKRVLIFSVSANLQLLATYCPFRASPRIVSTSIPDFVPPGEYYDRITSISWVGIAVVHVSASGRVGFLLPDSPLSAYLATPSTVEFPTGDISAAVQRFNSLKYQLSLLGLRAQDMQQGILCSLPRNILTSELGRILAILPDRMVFACIDQQSDKMGSITVGNTKRHMPTLNVVFRPLCPGEPVILSLLTLNPARAKALTEESIVTYWADAILDCVAQYYVPKQENGSGTESGAVPTGHSTGRLALGLVTAARVFLSPSESSGQNTSVDNRALNCLLLSMAAAVTGSCSLAADARADFPRVRWISPQFKFHVGLEDSTRNLLSVCADLFQERPELVELLLDQEAYCSSLPHPRSPQALECASAAHILMRRGDLHLARILADIAGDDLLVVSLLILDAAQGGSSSNAPQRAKSRDEDLRQLAESLVDINPRLHSVLLDVLNAKTSDEESTAVENLRLLQTNSPFAPPISRITIKSIDNGRRQGLQSIARPLMSTRSWLSQNPVTSGASQRPAAATSALKSAAKGVSEWWTSTQSMTKYSSENGGGGFLQFVEMQQKLRQQARGGGVGPPTALGNLALDSIEDFVGARLYPDILSVTDEAKGGLAALQKRALAASNHENTVVFAASGSTGIGRGVKPLAWTNGVGEGKEWDKVVGYWRFSDGLNPGSEGFFNTSSVAAARILLLDLSKYGASGSGTFQALELFSSDVKTFCLEPSTSPVDPGEDHEKVKALYDLVVAQNTSSGVPETDIRHGLRCVIGRGTPLDVGIFHTTHERSRMTLEIWVKFEGIAPSPYESHRIVERWTGGPVGSILGDGLLLEGEDYNAAEHALPRDLLWSLFVDSEGFVNFSFSGRSTIKSSSKAISFDSAQWLHIAFILDSSASTNDAPNANWNSTAIVSLFINGEMSCSGPLPVPIVDEKSLVASTLFVAPNLGAGWAVTELRIWADARSAGDIDHQKENHLALASKRKRLQNRIKGSKKMFSPLFPGSLVIGAPSEECTAIVTVLKKVIGKDEEEDSVTTSANAETSIVGGSLGISKPSGQGQKAGALKAPGLAPAPLGRRGSALTAPSSLSSSAPKELISPSLPTHSDTVEEVHSSEVSSASSKVKATSDAEQALPLSTTDHSGTLAPISKTPGLSAPSGMLAPPGGGMSSAAKARLAKAQQSSVQPETTHLPPPQAPSTSPIKASSGPNQITPIPIPSLPSTASTSIHSDPAPQLLATPPARDVVASLGSIVNNYSLQAARLSIEHINPQYNTKPLQHAGSLVGITDSSVNIFPLQSSNHFATVPVRVESAVVNNYNGGQLAGDSILATVTDKVVVVFAMARESETPTTALYRCIAFQPFMPIHFWSFVGSDSMFLVGPKSAYSWKLKLPDTASATSGTAAIVASQSKPIKLFDRIDMLPTLSTSAEKVKIIDVLFVEGWIMMTSDITRESGHSQVVSLFHSKSGRCGLFAAEMGSLLPGGNLALLRTSHEPSDQISLTMLDIERISWVSDVSSVSLSSELPASAIKWGLTMPGRVKDDISALLTYGDCIVTIPKRSSGSLRVIQCSTGTLQFTIPLSDTGLLEPSAVDFASVDGYVIVSSSLDLRPSAGIISAVLLLDNGLIPRIDLTKILKRMTRK